MVKLIGEWIISFDRYLAFRPAAKGRWEMRAYKDEVEPEFELEFKHLPKEVRDYIIENRIYSKPS